MIVGTISFVRPTSGVLDETQHSVAVEAAIAKVREDLWAQACCQFAR